MTRRVIHGARMTGRRRSSQMRACSASVGAATNRATHSRTPPSQNAQRATRSAWPEYPRWWKLRRNASVFARQNWYALRAASGQRARAWRAVGRHARGGEVRRELIVEQLLEVGDAALAEHLPHLRVRERGDGGELELEQVALARVHVNAVDPPRLGRDRVMQRVWAARQRRRETALVALTVASGRDDEERVVASNLQVLHVDLRVLPLHAMSAHTFTYTLEAANREAVDPAPELGVLLLLQERHAPLPAARSARPQRLSPRATHFVL
jgi:hypothetical protein